MYEGVSPEEKLLKHLRRPNNSLGHTDTNEKKSGALNADSKDDSTQKKGARNLFFIIDAGLVIISLILVAYIAYQFLFTRKNVNDIVNKLQGDAKITDFEIILAEPKPFSVYAQKINERDIFESPLQRGKKKTTDGSAPTSNLTKNLRLVGIVLDETREAIIEDLEVKRTFFLHEGEDIKGATIEEIQESKVILIYNGQKVELIQ